MLLRGVTVLDLTRVVAGPACTRTLSDLGADVIRIEPPDGDLLRRGVPKRGGVALGFAQQNAGKRHLCIDLTDPRGRDLALRLARLADVVVENYRPGVADRLGLGYQHVREVNPEVVYCSISGYGSDNASAHRRAYAPIIHAELGLVHLNARERGTEPLPEAVSHADFAVAAQASTGILAALVHRLRSGRGQRIEVSMAESMLAVNEFVAVEINGGVGDEISPFRPGKAALVRLADGSWIQIPGNPTTSIFAIARALGRESELERRGWHRPGDTRGKDAEVRELLQHWAIGFDSLEAFEAAIESSRIPLGKVKALSEVPNELWAQEREAFVTVPVGDEQARIPRSPFRIEGADVGPRSGAYPRGHHNRSALRELLGLDDEAITELEQSGVLQSE